MLFPMDVERIIHEIQQLEEMYEAPDIRPSIQAMSLLRIEGMRDPRQQSMAPALAEFWYLLPARESDALRS